MLLILVTCWTNYQNSEEASGNLCEFVLKTHIIWVTFRRFILEKKKSLQQFFVSYSMHKKYIINISHFKRECSACAWPNKYQFFFNLNKIIQENNMRSNLALLRPSRESMWFGVFSAHIILHISSLLTAKVESSDQTWFRAAYNIVYHLTEDAHIWEQTRVDEIKRWKCRCSQELKYFAVRTNCCTHKGNQLANNNLSQWRKYEHAKGT